jgi:tRNA guanosine-2'-O-methyltransferase
VSEEFGFGVLTDEFLTKYLSPDIFQTSERPSSEQTASHIAIALRCVVFLKIHFWTLAKGTRTLSMKTFTSLLALLGSKSELAVASRDALSALLPLLQTGRLAFHGTNPESLIRSQIWDRICDLLSQPSNSDFSGTAFRLWFRWIYQTGRFGTSQSYLQDDEYWSLIQAGLLFGYSEQRKLCLSILRGSLPLLEESIFTDHMSVIFEEQKAYEIQYEKYCTLFETLVLDRYPNQVMACRGDLSSMMSTGSLIHHSWMSTLLTAALGSGIQDGVRKIIGFWYIEFVSESQVPLENQQEFLLKGFLPWATQGFLFTSTIATSRKVNTCIHGNNLSKIIQNFIRQCSDTKRRFLMREIFNFILEKNGNIFPYAILYILEGLLEGFRTCAALDSLDAVDIDLVIKISSQTSLPEIARDLCTTYCIAFSRETSQDVRASVHTFHALKERYDELARKDITSSLHHLTISSTERVSNAGGTQIAHRETLLLTQRTHEPSLQMVSSKLHETKYKLLQGDGLLQACGEVLGLLDASDGDNITPQLLHHVLGAIWDEADTQDYPRAVAMKLPQLFFHPKCLQNCLSDPADSSNTILTEDLSSLITEVMNKLHCLSEGRSYILSSLASSIRRICLVLPEAINLLPLEDFLVRFANYPPLPKHEFLLEAVVADKLEIELPHRTYSSYYGKREWFGYACVIDLLDRLPDSKLSVGKIVLDRLLEPWIAQRPPVPIVSKWKTILQLQIMLILSEPCILRGSLTEVDHYLKSFMHVLALEPWPRHRFLLEWVLARLYLHSPEHRNQLLDLLADKGDPNPKLVASLLKMAVMVARFPDTPRDFTLRLMTQLIPLSASPKIQVRHEAHWSFPAVWDNAVERGWMDLLENPAFAALNAHIRGLEKFISLDSVHSSRSLKLDQSKDHTLANLFQGNYLCIDPPEREFVSVGDFEELWAEDASKNYTSPPLRIPIGSLSLEHLSIPSGKASVSETQSTDATSIASKAQAQSSIPLQTKSSTWQSSILSESPDSRHSTPLILVASLIDNPYNLGGLSRCAEIFGVHSLTLHSLETLNRKDFLSVAVTSHKHLPIQVVAPETLPDFLAEQKKEGYTVVCVEQTDQSKVLGEEGTKLPQKTVLVLGSEKEGVPAPVLAEADICVQVRQVGVTRSLNVQTAAAIALFEYQRQWC